MKIIAIPIDVVASFSGSKPPVPRKFRWDGPASAGAAPGGGGGLVVPVDRILSVEPRKTAGIPSYVYLCQSVMDGVEKRYELKYIVPECRWELYKI